MKRKITITDKNGVVRVDKFLALKFPEYSRAALAKLFDLNLIKLNGEPIQPGQKLRPGNVVEYDLGPLQAKPEVIVLPIIYEDDDVIVIDKPAGIISHARGRFWQEASVASFIRDKLKDIEGDRGGIVHRLDRATSGVMICAKNAETLSFLQKQFSERNVKKTYIAVCENHFNEQKAIIDAPIARNLHKPTTFKVSQGGKSARTEYEVIKEGNARALVKFTPLTGRTHQLRVHAKFIGHPIIGDAFYGRGKEGDRLMLHASSLEITLPGGKRTVFTSELPEEFHVD